MRRRTPTPGQTRNIAQSAQNRDVAKQASDIKVYINGADYLLNPYLGESGITVNFNNYVDSWQSTYDIDAMVPSGSLTLSVPKQDSELFQLPGGNHLLNTMSEIRVFAKGYYLSARGNSVYHQIFKGFISSISYAPDGMMLKISMNCFGALGILERMQIDLNPAVMSSSPTAAVPFTSTAFNLDPYKQIAFVFVYSSMIDGFEMYSVQQAAMQNGNPYFEAVKEGFVAQWQAYLYDLARDVHVFGAPNTNDVIASIATGLKKTNAANTPQDMHSQAHAHDVVGTANESDQIATQRDFYAQLRGYMPDMGFSSIQLLNGRVTSRLERLRFITSSVGFEAYQDVDGAVIVKPPLYNLDVLNLENDGSVAPIPKDPAIDPSLAWITDATNPFVVQLAEILNEQETEDEANVRLTRVTARGSWNPSLHWEGNKELLTVAEDIDVPKLTQFGLRTEPPREANWFRNGDDKAIYAYAASELARANRGFRYYSFTIPLRPEIKLGFPMYFPHKDVYGYIKSITMNWVKGATATTSIVCDSLRRRPLFPVTQNILETDSEAQQTVRLMTDQPDLVLQWTQQGENDSADNQGPQNAALAGKIASLPLPQQLVIKQQIQMTESRKATGLEYTSNYDTTTHNWRIQPEPIVTFSVPRSLDGSYFEDLRTIRPYTDNKGYEVVGPFPWGRWKSLKDSLTLFTIENGIYAASTNPALQPISPEPETLTNAAAFLFTGDSTAVSTENATDLVNTLATQSSYINNVKVFELAYTSDPTVTPGPGATLGASAPAQPTADRASANLDQLAATMLSGKSTSPSMSVAILNTVPKNITDDLAL